MLAGGASNAGSTPSWNRSNARLAVTRIAVGPHDHRRVRKVAVEDRVERLADRPERLVVER